MPLSSSPTDEEILSAVESWIDDLARADFDSAYARTDHDAYYGWSPELMRSVIAGNGLPVTGEQETKFAVTTRALAQGLAPRRTVDRDVKAPSAIAYVEYDLPLNGKWSDLTATFRVEARESGCALVLEQIHVL